MADSIDIASVGPFDTFDKEEKVPNDGIDRPSPSLRRAYTMLSAPIIRA